MTGLTATEAKKRQAAYGPNELSTRSDSFFVRIIKKFIGPIPLMIEAALLLSVIAGRFEDLIIIATLLAVNVGLDVIQEQRAQTALAALKETLAPTARAMRDGQLTLIAARDLVPGDVIKLALGDVVPADAALSDGARLEVDQSAVTGESLPVEKSGGAALFAGSTVRTGAALATITAIGRQSSLGTNARLVAEAANEKESHFQKAILTIGRFLILFSAGMIAIAVTVLLGRGESWLETAQFALVLAIASIPVALPAVLSVTMAIGAATLAKKRAIVAHFQSVEELAGVDELCVDKTGTLTKNALAVTAPVVFGDFDERTLLTYACLATDESQASATERAVFSYAHTLGADAAATTYARLEFSPFDPVRKHSHATVRDEDGQTFTILMGAPHVLLPLIDDQDTAAALRDRDGAMAKQGFRTMAVVRRDGETTRPVGIVPFADPPREDAAGVIASMRANGIHVRMLTGDSAATAGFIARLIGIGQGQASAPAGSSAALLSDETILQTEIFAEVVPEEKYRIVKMLQEHGHIVAMTGDGINDAPALKKADVGIAVKGALPAAREAADIVLLDEGLSVIQHAIYQARMTFARMQSYAFFRISETIRVILFITLAIIFFNDTPITAMMIILLALLNDIPVMAIAYDNAPIHPEPVRWHLRETLTISTLLGVAGVISSFILLYWLHAEGFSLAVIQTIIFLKLDVAGHSTLYLTRTGRRHFWQRPWPSLAFFIPAFGTRIAGTLIAVFGIFMHPIGWGAIGLIWLYTIVWFLLNDQVKVWGFKALDHFEKRPKTRAA